MKATIADEFSYESFLRTDDAAALAVRLQDKLSHLLMSGEEASEVIDGLIALGHALDFNDQWSGDNWRGELWVSNQLRLEYRLDFDSPRCSGTPAGVELEVSWAR